MIKPILQFTMNKWIYLGLKTNHLIVIKYPPQGRQEQTRTTRTPAFWDTPRRPMITHTSDSHQIPSQNNTKSKLQNLKNYQNFKF